MLHGGLEIWASDDRPFEVEVKVLDYVTHELLPLASFSQIGEAYEYSGAGQDEGGMKLAEWYNPDAYFNGGWALYPGNNRAMAEITLLNANYLEVEDNKVVAGKLPVFVMKGHPGQSIEVYAQGSMGFYRTGLFGPQELDATTDGAINTWGIGNGVIVVGSYNTRSQAVRADGSIKEMWYYGSPNQMSAFSSYGNLANGETYPHLVAPGSVLIAAGSQYGYVEGVMEDFGEPLQGSPVIANNRENYYISMSGTSMSSPFATGTVALWLQANPELTSADVLEIMRKTCRQPEDPAAFAGWYANDPARWGYGMLDAYAGLKEAIKESSGVSQVAADQPQPVVKLVGRTIEVSVPDGAPCATALFNALGAKVRSAHGSIDAAGLPAGVYVLTVNDFATKIAIK